MAPATNALILALPVAFTLLTLPNTPLCRLCDTVLVVYYRTIK